MSSIGRTIKRKETTTTPKIKEKRARVSTGKSKISVTNEPSTNDERTDIHDIHETNDPSGLEYTESIVGTTSDNIQIQYTSNTVRLSELSTKSISAFKEHIKC